MKVQKEPQARTFCQAKSVYYILRCTQMSFKFMKEIKTNHICTHWECYDEIANSGL